MPKYILLIIREIIINQIHFVPLLILQPLRLVDTNNNNTFVGLNKPNEKGIY